MYRILFSLGLIFSTLSPAFGSDRIALVIGNSNYESAPKLKNPKSDAEALGETFQRLGFDTLIGLDLTYLQLRDLIHRFTVSPFHRFTVSPFHRFTVSPFHRFSVTAEQAELAVVYYAGHGIQVDGKNYLVPIDAELNRESDLDFESIDLELVMRQLSRVNGDRVILLDACRDNPFETRLKRSLGETRSTSSTGRGLAPIEAEGGTFVGFATDPGDVAFDGEESHSPFAQALLDNIEQPDLEINALMTRVRSQVFRDTNKRQRPWASSSLLNELYLASGMPLKEAERNDTIEIADAQFWKTVQLAESESGLQKYLDRFPDGLFSDIAKDRLRTLSEKEEPAVGATAVTGGEEAQLLGESEIATLAFTFGDLTERELIHGIQGELNRLGCEAGRPDGKSGPRTRRAIRSFDEITKGKKYVRLSGNRELFAELKSETRPVCTVLWYSNNAFHFVEGKYEATIDCRKVRGLGKTYRATITEKIVGERLSEGTLFFQGHKSTGVTKYYDTYSIFTPTGGKAESGKTIYLSESLFNSSTNSQGCQFTTWRIFD